MTVRIYRSTDASAPTLTGQVGSLTSLLDAVLVNGYGSQAAAGWSIGYTAANKRAYQQNTAGANLSTGAFLYVDDTGPGAGGAREARVCGFETMSAITPTGTGQFPTAAQSSVGVGTLVIRKSATADSTARAWTCIANGQTFYLFTESGDYTTPVLAMPFVFGDFVGYRSSDSYAICIIGRTAENTAVANVDPLHSLYSDSAFALTNPIIGHFVARSWTAVGGSVQVSKLIDIGKQFGSGNAVGSGSFVNVGTPGAHIGRYPSTQFPYPNPPDGALWLSPISVGHTNCVRGYLRGLWAPLHDRPLNHDDTYTVSGGNLSGKSFIAQSILVWNNSDNLGGQVHIETSDTWN